MAERIEKLREGMTKKRIDGFLIMNERNIFYFTGAIGANLLLIPRDGENILYVYSVNYNSVNDEAKNCIVEKLEKREDLTKKSAKKIQDLKLKNIGFDSLSVESFIQFRRLLRGKAKLKPKSELVWNLRKVKDEKEIELIQKAAEITSKAMQKAYEIVQPGMTEIEATAEIEYEMRKAGAWGYAFETLLASGPRTAYCHGYCTEKKIEKDELVVIDLGAVYKGYRADMTRTLVVGKPSKKQEKIFNIVKEAQERAFQSVKSGKKAREVDAVARNFIKEAGYGEYFVHGLGHGVGLDVHEPPTLNSESKDRLKAGNVVTIEPGIYIPGFGGVRIEDTVLVKRRNAERLTKGPYTLTLS
ncbi:hypothetical protein DRO54_03885 [Candidatus Bathyarchaeota archaeon]|nr:MAG: hypothetical protein DRO54_03885 [Candidatus Bathyarchaeota archaeon]